MRRFSLITLLVGLPGLALLFPGPATLHAAQETGYVHAADEVVPGAMVTARQGEMKVVAYSDANGRYVLNLGPGVWDIQVEILGFTPSQQQVTIGPGQAPDQVSRQDFSMEMPKYGQAPPASGIGGTTAPAPAAASATSPATTPSTATSSTAAPATTAPATTATTTTPGQGGGRRGGGGGRGQFGGGRGQGRGGAPGAAGAQGPGFQNAQVTATQDGQDALAAAAAGGAGGLGVPDDSDQAFLVNGSTSGGLGAASDDNARQQRQGGGPGGRGGGDNGLGGQAALGLPPGMSALDSSNLGLGGLGADAINGGFGAGGNGGGPGGGPGGGGGAGFGGGGGGGGGRGGGRGGGGGGGRGGGRGGRGANGGQFNSFGNRRRNTQPAYTGSIALTMTNSALNAEPYSLNGTAAVKPPSSSATYVGNLGGPLIIPKILNYQRAQFQLNYQGVNSNKGQSTLSEVPTALERTGNFNGLVVGTTPTTIYDPLSGQPFPNNTIPTARLDQAALGLLNYYPQPTYSGVVQNYRIVSSAPSNSQSMGIRLNTPLPNNKDRFNFNIQVQNRNSASEQLFGFRDTGTGYGTSESITWNHSFAPRFNNSAVVSWSRNVTQSNPYFASAGINVASQLGITGTSQLPLDYGPPSINVSSFGGLSDSEFSVTRSQTLSFTDTVTYVWKRKHNLSFGYSYRIQDNDPRSEQTARGSFSFDGLRTSQLTAQGTAAPGTGYGLADFLLGLPYSTSINLGSNDYFRGWSTAGFAQDDYRLGRGLTLNLGLRYEYFAPYSEEYNRISNLVVNPDLTQAALVVPAQSPCPTIANGPTVYCGVDPYTGAVPSSLVRAQKDLFSPRLGFAWRPWAKHSTVIRGGYSIFHSGSFYGSLINASLSAEPPFTESAIYTNSAIHPLTLEDGFPAAGSTAASSLITNTFGISSTYKLPYAQNWTFAVAQTLPHNVLMEFEYLGTKGTDLGVALAPPITNANAFVYNTWGANSSYNAGQVRTTRRFSTGMSAVLLYTYSHAMDNASSFSGTGGTVTQNPFNWRPEWGPSTFDQRHKISLTYTLSSPVGVRGFMRNGGWKTHALAGWTLNGTYNVGTGLPITATLGGTYANTGGLGAIGGAPRAEATGISIAPVAPGQFFNPAAFTAPPAGQLGDAGVGTIRGPLQMSEGATLNRAWRFPGEGRKQLQFRLTANNPLNHVYITGFGTAYGATNYGLPTAASGTRTVTALFRFNF